MGKPSISKEIIVRVHALRRSGKSIKEIVSELKLGTGTVSKYCKNVALTSHAKNILDSKRYPAKQASLEEKRKAALHAEGIIQNLDSRDVFLIFTALYWGEGTKSELNIINGDSKLILFFVKGLLSLGINKNRIKISVRYYPGQSKVMLIDFWLQLLHLDKSNIVGFELVKGSTGKFHKLAHGMCRVRVEKSSYYHKLVSSGIDIISSGSSMDRTEAS